jgi:CheY-like chemotaxis protein
MTNFSGQNGDSFNKRQLADARLLIVEDDDDSRLMLMTALKMYGAQVEAACDVAEAVAILSRAEIDLIVSDIGLPNEDGYALLQKVRAAEIEKGRHIPAIALTGYASREDATRALAAGFQKHLTKPIEPRELVNAVADLIKSEEMV